MTHFQHYWDTLRPFEKRAIAHYAHTSMGYLVHIAAGRRRPSVKMAKALIRASREVTPDRPLTREIMLNTQTSPEQRAWKRQTQGTI